MSTAAPAPPPPGLGLQATIGLLSLLGGLPLILRAVPPNRWAGFRTPRTRRDDALWYDVNAVRGWWLRGVGAATVVAAVGIHQRVQDVNIEAGLGCAVLLLSLLGMTLHGVVVLRRALPR